jgi:hypothetical protein
MPLLKLAFRDFILKQGTIGADQDSEEEEGAADGAAGGVMRQEDRVTLFALCLTAVLDGKKVTCVGINTLTLIAYATIGTVPFPP